MQNWKSLGLQARATDVAEHIVVFGTPMGHGLED